MHCNPPDYDNRVQTHDRAMRAGLDDVGLGTLFGLYDYKYEVRRPRSCRRRRRASPPLRPTGVSWHCARPFRFPASKPSPTPPPGAGHADARQPPGARVRGRTAHHLCAAHAPRRRLRRASPGVGQWVGRVHRRRKGSAHRKCPAASDLTSSHTDASPWTSSPGADARRCRWRRPTPWTTPTSRSWWPSCA